MRSFTFFFSKLLKNSTAFALIAISSLSSVFAMEGTEVIKTTPTKQKTRSTQQEKVPSALHSSFGSERAKGQAERIETIGNAIKVTTKQDTTSYLLESNRFTVKEGQTIKIPYEINVAAGGNITLGLLNTKMNGWFLNKQYHLTEGLQKGTFVVSVPKGETQTSLVIRNAQKNPAQTIFTVNNIEILKEEASPIVVSKPKLEPTSDILSSTTTIPTSQESILQPKGEVISSDLDPTFGSGRAKNMAEKIERDKKTKAITVTTKKDTGSYELESKRFSVNESQMIKIPYEITVKAGGRMSLGLLRTDTKGWYGKELTLEAGEKAQTFKGVYERMVPKGETEASLVFRNAQKNPAQTIFTIKNIEILKEQAGKPIDSSYLPIVIKEPKGPLQFPFMLNEADLLNNLEKAKQSYQDLFHSSFPADDEEKKTALTHLLTALHIQNDLAPEQPCFSLINPLQDTTQLEKTPHNIIITDKQLADPNIGYKLQNILQAKPHTLILSVGEGDFVKNNALLFDWGLPAFIKKLWVVDPKGIVKIIGDNFLRNHPDLTEIHMPLTHLTTIGSSFLGGCPELTKVHLPFTNLTTVGDSFLHNCTRLTEVDLPFTNLTTIGDDFLLNCTRLTEVDLPSTHLTTIGGYFFYGCTGLIEVDLPFTHLTTIGNFFLGKCTGLTNVHMPFTNLTTIRNYFLDDCTGLIEVDMPFTNLTTIGNYFLNGCTGLIEVDLPFTHLTTIGNYFLDNCTGLIEVDMPFTNLTTIGNYFLYSCTGLTNVHMPFPNLTTIGNNFLDSCTQLTEVDLPFTQLATIGNYSFQYCTKLKTIVTPTKTAQLFMGYLGDQIDTSEEKDEKVYLKLRY